MFLGTEGRTLCDALHFTQDIAYVKLKTTGQYRTLKVIFAGKIKYWLVQVQHKKYFNQSPLPDIGEINIQQATSIRRTRGWSIGAAGAPENGFYDQCNSNGLGSGTGGIGRNSLTRSTGVGLQVPWLN